ncbi:unnamed protein product [Lota lota]
MEEGGHPSEKLMDDFFKSIGLQRKKIAKDGSCLFRAVAEQVLQCQSLHTQVRARCVEFLKEKREVYEAFIEGDFEDYLCKIQDPQHWVGEVEINALAIIYKRDFLIFQEPGKPAVNITANGFEDQVQLCFLNGNHYDSVYPVSHIQNTAFCQSLLYELLYERVFREERSVLYSGLRGCRSSELTDDHMNACPSSDESETEDPKWWEPVCLSACMGRGRGRGRGRGLSERLRRSLNPNLLRNVDYDVWHTSKRVQQKMDFCMAAGMQYSEGDRCQVCLEAGGRSYSGSIRKVSPSNGPVTVYIEELGKQHMQLPAAYVSNTPLPQNVVPQTSLPQDPILPPSVPQNPLPQPSAPQNLVHSNPIPQHPVPQHPVAQPPVPQHPVPCVPQHPVPEPSVPQPPVPQHPVPEPSVPQHPVAQPPVPQHPVPEPSVPQHPVAQPPVPQPPVAQPSVPQHPVAQPPVPQHPVAQPSVPQHPVAQPFVPRYPETQSSVPQHPVAQPSVPQHPETQSSVPQYPETQSSVPQYPVPEPSVPKHPGAHHSVPQYPQLQVSNPLPGLSPTASQASAGSPPHPSHPHVPPLPPYPLPPQHTFNPSSWLEPSQGAVPLQQLSQLYQDPLYPGFPVGSTGDMQPTPAYSSSKTGDDLPRDVNVLRWFFNLGVKAYSNPMFQPYVYLVPLQQSHIMHPPLRDPSPQGVHPSPPLPWQHTAPPPLGHLSGYPSPGPGPRYPGTMSPGLQLCPSDRQQSSPGRSPGPGPRHQKLEGYGATGGNRANAASDAMLANVGVGSPAGVLADQGHHGLSRQVLLIDPPLNNMPIWVSEPKFQDSMVAVTTTPHGNCGAPSLHGQFGNTHNSNQRGNHFHGYRPYNGQMINPPEVYGQMGSGPGMELWKVPESGSSSHRGRRSYHHQRGGGGERPGRGNRQRYSSNFDQYGPAHRTRDQGY